MSFFENCKFLNPTHKNRTRYTVIGKGYALLDQKHEDLLTIHQKDANRANHTFIFGAPGVGKTRLLEGMIEQDIPKGHNVVIIDPKGDLGLFSKAYQTALRAGRKDEVIMLSPVYPQYSMHASPLRHWYIEEELIAHVVSGVPSDDEFFFLVAKDTTTVIVKTLLAIKRQTSDKAPLSFQDISTWCYYQGLGNLRGSLEKLDDFGEKRALMLLFDQILSSPQDYFSKISNTLRTTLTEMTMGNIGKIMGNTTENVLLDRLEKNEGVIAYIQTGSLLTREVSKIISKVTISTIQSMVGRYYASGDSFDRPLNLYIDEMASTVYYGIETLYAQGRAANVCITGLTQSMADIVAEIGEDRAKRLFDLTSTKIIMRLNESDSADLISKLGGQKVSYSPFLSLDGSLMTREVEESAIKSEDVQRLGKREFYYFGFEGEFKGKTAPIKDSEIQIEMPKVTNLREDGV